MSPCAIMQHFSCHRNRQVTANPSLLSGYLAAYRPQNRKESASAQSKMAQTTMRLLPIPVVSSTLSLALLASWRKGPIQTQHVLVLDAAETASFLLFPLRMPPEVAAVPVSPPNCPSLVFLPFHVTESQIPWYETGHCCLCVKLRRGRLLFLGDSVTLSAILAGTLVLSLSPQPYRYLPV